MNAKPKKSLASIQISDVAQISTFEDTKHQVVVPRLEVNRLSTEAAADTQPARTTLANNWERKARIGNNVARESRQISVEKNYCLVTECAADVITKPLKPLWNGVLWRGKPTVIAGQPGLGKSLLTLDIAARLTNGEPMPGEMGPCQPCNVLIATAEDDVGDTTVPRLKAAGADLRRIHFISEARNADTDEAFMLDRHLRHLCATIEGTQAALVVVDPLSAYMGNTDTHKDAEVRQVLGKLAKIATDTDCAIIAVAHLNKSEGRNAIGRVSGSTAFVAASRSAWIVARDKDEPDVRRFVPMKVNLAPDVLSYSYTIVEHMDSPRIQWADDQCSDITADELVDVDCRARGSQARKAGAFEWLRKRLSNGPVSANNILAAAREAKHDRRSLDEACKKLGVNKSNAGGNLWMWRLPDA